MYDDIRNLQGIRYLKKEKKYYQDKQNENYRAIVRYKQIFYFISLIIIIVTAISAIVSCITQEVNVGISCSILTVFLNSILVLTDSVGKNVEHRDSYIHCSHQIIAIDELFSRQKITAQDIKQLINWLKIRKNLFSEQVTFEACCC